MKTRIKQVLAVIAICGFIAACKFSNSEQPAADSSQTDTASVLSPDTTKKTGVADTVSAGQ